MLVMNAGACMIYYPMGMCSGSRDILILGNIKGQGNESQQHYWHGSLHSLWVLAASSLYCTNVQDGNLPFVCFPFWHSWQQPDLLF